MRAITLALGLLAAAQVTVADGRTAGPSTESPQATLIARFLNNHAEPLTHYRATRRIEATNQRFKKHGWIEVRTELSSDGVFSFEVLGEGGSSVIRNKVLRPILEGERQIVSGGDSTRTALTTSNYDIAAGPPAGDGLVRLLLKPLRKEMTLVEGAVWVTDTEADLVRVEGRLAKSPSFWTRRVDIVRRYGRVAGVRVPLSVESTAHVRIAGPSAMTMTYQYEMVNGRPVTSPESALVQ